MRILILGGTQFVGRHLVEAALAGGHEVTLFHRGRTGPDLFPDLEHVLGDRQSDLGLLSARTWDAVVDTSGYVPRIVRMSAQALREAAERYLFISTISVYEIAGLERVDEGSPLQRLEDPGVEEVTGETYGGLKVLCEEAVREVWGGRAAIVRPGIVAGPHDPTDRVTYWVSRAARGGKMAVPARLEQPLQFVDARDLAAFCLKLLVEGDGGTYSVTAPPKPLAFGEFVDLCRSAAGEGAAEPVPVAADVVEAAELGKRGLPIVLPEDGSADALMRVDVSRALSAGFSPRPTSETIADVLAWERGRPADHEWKAGPSAEAERALLGLG
jgi:2'-hydroxyisoflavone reductase